MVNTNMKNIKELLSIYIKDPQVYKNNFNLARYYHTNGQTASAVSYYLRAAERTDDKELQYLCLILAAKCFESQGMRNFTVKGLYKNAITTITDRPEAYYFLSKLYEREDKDGSWNDAYLTACIGVDNCKDKKYNSLAVDVEYPGYHGLLLQKAINGYTSGVCDESRGILGDLVNYVNVGEDFLDQCRKELDRISETETPLKVESNYYGDERWRGFLFDNIIKELNYKSYLELGVRCGNNSWKLIECENKVGVDLDENVKFPGVINVSTDDYFENLDSNTKFDLIFIDACHEKNFVYRDFCNSYKHLNDGGMIVMHDIHPLTENHCSFSLNGNVYEFWIELVNNYSKNTFTYIGYPGHQEGTVGIYIKNGSDFDPTKFSLKNYTYNHFSNNIGKYLYHRTITQNQLIFNVKNSNI